MDIKESNLDQLVKEYLKSQEAKEEYEALQQVIKDELSDRLRKMKLSGTKAGGCYITRAHRYVFTDVKMSDAEELGAVKTAIDTTKLGSMLKKGVKIHGVKSIEYLLIKKETTAA